MIVIRRYDFSRKPNLYAECGKMAGVQPLPSPKPGWAPLTQKQGCILGGKSLSIRTGQPTPRQGQWASPCPQPEAGGKYQVSSSPSPDPPEIKEGARTCWPHPALPPPGCPPSGVITQHRGRFRAWAPEDTLRTTRGVLADGGAGTGWDHFQKTWVERGQTRPGQSCGSGLAPHPSQK